MWICFSFLAEKKNTKCAFLRKTEEEKKYCFRLGCLFFWRVIWCQSPSLTLRVSKVVSSVFFSLRDHEDKNAYIPFSQLPVSVEFERSTGGFTALRNEGGVRVQPPWEEGAYVPDALSFRHQGTNKRLSAIQKTCSRRQVFPVWMEGSV